MSANDDDAGGDDDQLKQLRSVWVSMRESDADPPDRGLDALMAAARTKAADMAPPASEGFWTKVLAVFRRPPVLALASLTVVLGGALFIAQRRDKMQVDERAPERQVETTKGSSEPAPAKPDVDGSPPLAAPGMGSGSPPPLPETVEPPPAEVTRTRTRPQGNKGTSTSPAIATEKVERDAKKAVKREEGGEDVPIADPTSTTSTVGGLAQVQPDAVKDVPQGTTRAPVVKAPANNDSFGRVDSKLAMEDESQASAVRPSKESQVTQLVKQCESAAARNDCPAVRVLAKKIRDADAEAYKQRVAKNTAIARCLE